MALTYLIGTSDAKRTPTRDISKFVKSASLGKSLSAPTELRIRLNNPNGVFTDSARNDYIDNDFDYSILIKNGSDHVLRGVVIDREGSDKGSSTVTWIVRTDSSYMERCILTKEYSPSDYVFVEDVIEDMFSVASPDPKEYFGLGYFVQNTYDEDFDDYDDGDTPSDWEEQDANGEFVVKSRLYNSTDPLYFSEFNSVRYKTNASSSHAVLLDDIQFEGEKVIVSFRAYIAGTGGNMDFYFSVRNGSSEIAKLRFRRNSNNTTVYAFDNATGYAIFGPAGASDQWYTFRLVLDFTSDTYAVYFSNANNAPKRKGMNVDYSAAGNWSTTYYNDFRFSTSQDQMTNAYLVFSETGGSAQYIYLDDFYVVEGLPLVKTPLTGIHRFSSVDLMTAVTDLCSYYGLEWREMPDRARVTGSNIQTFKLDPDASAVLTVDEASDIFEAETRRTASRYKNFFIVEGGDGIVAYAADVDSINDHGFFPKKVRETVFESMQRLEEASEAMRHDFARDPLQSSVQINGDVAGYSSILDLEAGDNITVSADKVGLGSSQTYVLNKVRFSVDETVVADLELGDIWKSSALLAFEALREKTRADSAEPEDLVHIRYLAAKVALSGDWDFTGSTATVPSAGTESHITEFGKRAVREMQATNSMEDAYISPYVERPAKFRLIDNQGAVLDDGAGGLKDIDTWTISSISTDGDGNKYCEIEFDNGSGVTVSAYFTWARTEVVTKRQYTLVESLGTSDARCSLDNTEGLRVNDELVITNSAGNTVTVYVTDIVGNKVYINGTHANEMDPGSIAEAYTNALFAFDHDEVAKDSGDTVRIKMTVRFTNEETPTCQGQLTEHGLTQLCQRLRSAEQVGTKTMNGTSTTTTVYTNDTKNINTGDYILLHDISENEMELVSVASIVANTSITVNETMTASRYVSGDKIEVASYPWGYIVFGNDNASHGSNYYNSKYFLDGELSRAMISPIAPSTADKVKATAQLRGRQMQPAMANTTLDGNHTAQTQLKVLSTEGMVNGQTVYVGNSLPLDVRTISSVDSPTQITVSSAVTATDGDPVCTGMRRDGDSVETVYEIAIADLPVETEVSDAQYYLGQFTRAAAEVSLGHGSYQYDEYLARDSENNEYNLKGTGTSTTPTTFYSEDQGSDCDYITSVEGIGISYRPIVSAWKVNIIHSELFKQTPEGGSNAEYRYRIPRLEYVRGQGIPFDPYALKQLDDSSKTVVGNAFIPPRKETIRYERKTDFERSALVGAYIWAGEKLGRIQTTETLTTPEGVYPGMLVAFDASNIFNKEYQNPDKLGLFIYGHGRSWDYGNDEWRNGLKAFVWVQGNFQYEGNVKLGSMHRDVLPHWEPIPLYDPNGNVISSTGMRHNLLMGQMKGGHTFRPHGNRIRQAIVDGQIYVLIIPEFYTKKGTGDLAPGDLPTYVDVDYVALGIGEAAESPEGTKTRPFRKGIDYHWSKDWQWIVWPPSTPYHDIGTLLNPVKAGSTIIALDYPNILSPGDVVFVGSNDECVTVVELLDDFAVRISPPLHADYAAATSVYVPSMDYGLDLYIDNKWRHAQHPTTTTSMAVDNGVGIATRVTDVSVATLTVASTEGFAANDDVMLIDANGMKHEWSTVSSLTDKRTLVLTTPVSLPSVTHIGKCTVPVGGGDDAYATPQMLIPSYDNILLTIGDYSNRQPPNAKDDTFKIAWQEAGLPGAMVDYIDEADGIMYVSVCRTGYMERQSDNGTPDNSSTRWRLDDSAKAWGQNNFKGGTCTITYATGKVVSVPILKNSSTAIYFEYPVPAAPANVDAYDIAEEQPTSFAPGAEYMEDTTGTYAIWYDARFLVDCQAAGNPVIKDISDTNTFTSSNAIRVVRGAKVSVKTKVGDTAVYKAGAVVDEVANAIDNENLCSEEVKLASDTESSFILNSKYGPDFVTNTTTGRVRHCIDIVDQTNNQGTTTLSAIAYLGATTLTMVSTAGMSPGDLLLVDPTTAGSEEIVQIQTVDSGTQVTVESALIKKHANGATVWRAYYEKILINTFNPYGPPGNNASIVAVSPYKLGATYKVTYMRGRGRILARAVLSKSDISTPVTLKDSETLKTGIELSFTYD